MDVLTVVVAGVLLALFTSIQTWISKGRFDAMDHRFDAIDQRLDAHDRRFDQLFGELAQLRSDLLQVALAATPRPQAG